MGSELLGKVAIVTGAGRGIGAAVARALAAQGAHVVANDLGVGLDGAAEAESLVAGVARDIVAKGDSACADPTDITEADAVDAMVARTVKDHGKVDIAVNIAGILRDRMIFNMSDDDWDAVIRVHLRGTFNITRAVSRHWRSDRTGVDRRLINFSSVSALFGAPGQGNYAAAKMGVIGLTYTCANSLNRYGATSNVVVPTAATRMTQTIPGRSDFGADSEYTPENVAAVVSYLAGPRASWCNGQVISARGRAIGLYNRPALISQVTSTDDWDFESAAEAVESFRPLVDQVNPDADE